MGDSGEGLVDADARIQERMEELEQSRQAAKNPQPAEDPERVRARESLRLARTEMQRQLEQTQNPARRTQIQNAVAEIDKRLSSLS